MAQLQGQGRSDGVPEFWTEDDQREHNRDTRIPHAYSDILFCESSAVAVMWIRKKEKQWRILIEWTKILPIVKLSKGIIHWCDAKMMYRKLDDSSKQQVRRKILKTAQKYEMVPDRSSLFHARLR
jgi:hypothetical protein